MPITSIDAVSTASASLKVLMDEALDRIVGRFNYHNVPLPTKQYWMVGQPVIDCEQLVLSVGQLYIGSPGDQANDPMRSNSPRSVVFRVTLARAVPSVDGRGHSPTTEKIQAGSEILAVDAWTLLDAVAFLDQWEAYGGFGLGVIATVDVDEPSGGIQSITSTFTMAIP
jgi:hypothetical protein